MAMSVRVDPLLEKELELAAKRQGITKSQFVIDAIERALDRKNPYDLLLKVRAEEAQNGRALKKAFKGAEIPYDTEASRNALIAKLKVKHSVGGPR